MGFSIQKLPAYISLLAQEARQFFLDIAVKKKKKILTPKGSEADLPYQFKYSGKQKCLKRS